MSKFNKIISIILVTTIIIGLIPISTHNVKAYENEQIEIKGASAIGDILLYIIYILLSSGIGYASWEIAERVSEGIQPKVDDLIQQQKAAGIGPKRENYDSDQEWSDAWLKWYTGNQIVRDEDGNYVEVISWQSEFAQKVLEYGKEFLDSRIELQTKGTIDPKEGTTEYVQSIIYDEENKYYRFGGINSPFQAWEEFDKETYPNQVIFTTKNWRAFLVATDGDFYIRKTHNGLYSYDELVSTSGKMAIAFKEYDVWSNYHNLSIYDRYVWQVSNYNANRISLEYLDEFQYSTQNLINENDEIVFNKNVVESAGNVEGSRLIWSMLPDEVNKISPYSLDEYPYQLLFVRTTVNNELIETVIKASSNNFVLTYANEQKKERYFVSREAIHKRSYICVPEWYSQGKIDENGKLVWEQQIDGNQLWTMDGVNYYERSSGYYDVTLYASTHDIYSLYPQELIFSKNVSAEDEVIGVEKIISVEGIIHDPRMLERALDPMPNSKDTYEDKYIKIPENANQTDISTTTPTDVVGDIVEQDGEEVFVPVPETFPQDIDRVGDFPGTIEGINAGVKTVNWQLTKIRELIGDLAISTPATPDMHLEVPEGKIDITLPNILILLLGVLAAIIRLVIRFLIFIKELVLVAPSNTVLPDEMILGLEFLKNHQIPYFNMSFYDLFSSLMMFMFGVKIIKVTKSYAINYSSDFSNIEYETMKIDHKLY